MRVAARLRVFMYSLSLALLVSACGDGAGESEVERTSCPRLGDDEVSCRFDGVWSRPDRSYEASVHVGSNSPFDGFSLSVGRIGERSSYQAWSFTPPTDTSFVGPVQIRFTSGDQVFDGSIEVELVDAGTVLRVHVIAGELLGVGSTFEGAYVRQ